MVTADICSHDPAQLELVCNGVPRLRDGRLTDDGTVRDVAHGLPAPGHILRTSDDLRAAKMLVPASIEYVATARGVQVASAAAQSTVLAVLVTGGVSLLLWSGSRAARRPIWT